MRTYGRKGPDSPRDHGPIPQSIGDIGERAERDAWSLLEDHPESVWVDMPSTGVTWNVHGKLATSTPDSPACTFEHSIVELDQVGDDSDEARELLVLGDKHGLSSDRTE